MNEEEPPLVFTEPDPLPDVSDMPVELVAETVGERPPAPSPIVVQREEEPEVLINEGPPTHVKWREEGFEIVFPDGYEDLETLAPIPAGLDPLFTDFDPASRSIEPAVQRCADEKWEAIKAKRQAVYDGGCQTPKGKIDSTQESLIVFLGLDRMAEKIDRLYGPGTFTQAITMWDNSNVVHNGPEIEAAAMALGYFRAAAHQVSQLLRGQLVAALEIEDPAEAQAAIAAVDPDGAPWPV